MLYLTSQTIWWLEPNMPYDKALAEAIEKPKLTGAGKTGTSGKH